MKIAIFSKTPLAAAPWELLKALRKYTLHKVSLINVMRAYPDGRSFPFDLLFYDSNGAARAALTGADLWHVHNYLAPDLVGLRNGRRVVAQFHSLPRLGNWDALMRWASKSYTIRQPLQEKEYGLPALPNVIDPDEYRPGCRPARVTIAFAPSTRAPIGSLSSKGYHEVRRTLDSIALKRDVEITVIEGLSYEANLCLKQRAHILIDDVVTGNWHRTSLEGACYGCAVLNKISSPPFVYATVNTLEERLLWLIDNRGALADLQEQARLWVLREFHAIDSVKEYVKAYAEALQ